MTAYWENDQQLYLPLTEAPWEFRLGPALPQAVWLPAAWETHTQDKTIEGPALYRRAFEIPDGWQGRRILLDAQGISFHAGVSVNGRPAGEHSGAWSPFQLDVTDLVRPGRNAIALEVWKPGRRFPLRESLAGFLPDVCTTFGGIWQPLGLRAIAEAAFADVQFHTRADGALSVQGRWDNWSGRAVATVSLEVFEQRGGQSIRRHVASAELDRNAQAFRIATRAPGVTTWNVSEPGPRYTARLSLSGGPPSASGGQRRMAAVTRRIAFRDVAINAGRTLWNGRPVHFRGVLDWGWNPERVAPHFFDDRDRFARARALGFNLWKLCLYVPPESFFDAADEAGLPVWLEMPLWLPQVTPALKALALREYAAVLRRLHHHPCLALLSLGCELNAQADAEFLRALHDLARAWLPNTLLCDNSGSAEAYGGVEAALSDFYDYHFYTDPHFFAPLAQHFRRAHRPDKPWIYGEFCDADTLRDFGRVAEAWWLRDPVPLDREEHTWQREHARRLSAAGVTDGGAALADLGRRQATALRQFILESVRREHATGGYVVTGWADTPITTSGVVDDAGALKFEPDAWRRFNADIVLSLDRERRRRWQGGDRPNPKDPFVWWQDEAVELHLVVSNGSAGPLAGQPAWTLADAGGATVAAGQLPAIQAAAGAVQEVGRITWRWPAASDLRTYTLSAAIGAIHNHWQIWAVPRPAWPRELALAGPLLHRPPLGVFGRATAFSPLEAAGPATVALAEALTPEVLAHLGAGGRVLLWQTQPDQRFTHPLPFWREAIHVFEPDRLWDRVPHAGHADLRFFGVATDLALDRAGLAAVVGGALQPIWRRFDARQMTWADYVVVGQMGAAGPRGRRRRRGRLLATSLRLAGGLGAQPVGLETNPLGAWLLAALLERLADG